MGSGETARRRSRRGQGGTPEPDVEATLDQPLELLGHTHLDLMDLQFRVLLLDLAEDLRYGVVAGYSFWAIAQEVLWIPARGDVG